MRPVLDAMKSREKALSTVQMLERDRDAKEAKLRQLEIQPNKQAKAIHPMLTFARSVWFRPLNYRMT